MIAYRYTKLETVAIEPYGIIVFIRQLKNLNYLIIDCCKFNKYYSHFNLDEALHVHNQKKKKKTILTNLHSDFDYDFLLQRTPNNVLPAYDGLRINL